MAARERAAAGRSARLCSLLGRALGETGKRAGERVRGAVTSTLSPLRLSAQGAGDAEQLQDKVGVQDRSSSHPSCCRGFWPGSGSLVAVLTHEYLDSCAQAPVHTLAHAHTFWHAGAAFCACLLRVRSQHPEPIPTALPAWLPACLPWRGALSPSLVWAHNMAYSIRRSGNAVHSSGSIVFCSLFISPGWCHRWAIVPADSLKGKETRFNFLLFN